MCHPHLQELAQGNVPLCVEKTKAKLNHGKSQSAVFASVFTRVKQQKMRQEFKKFFFSLKQSLDDVLELPAAQLLLIKHHFPSEPLFALIRQNDQTLLHLWEQETKLSKLITAQVHSIWQVVHFSDRGGTCAASQGVSRRVTCSSHRKT